MFHNATAGILLVLGFISILAASFVGPPNLYQETSVDRQIALVDEHRAAWITSNALFGLAAVLTATGLVLWALNLRTSAHGPVAGAGAAAYVLGTLAYLLFLYKRTIDPAQLFRDYAFSSLTVVLAAGLVVGLLLVGVVFLSAEYPRWLGWSFIAGMVLVGGAALFFPGPFFKSFPPQALFLFTLVAGIVLWSR